MDEERQKEFREGPFSHLPFGGGEIVRTAARIIKVSSYGAVHIHHDRTDRARAHSTVCTTALSSRRGTRAAWCSSATPRTPPARYVSAVPHEPHKDRYDTHLTSRTGTQHLGQGANQAMEDCYHLTRLLAHNPSGAPPSTALLETIFTEFESLRIARTSELVKGARQQGELRVVSGAEACKKRNEVIVEMYSSFAAGGSEGLVAQFKHLVEHPFKAGASEI